MQRVVGIKFRPDGRTYFFLPPAQDLEIGQKVVVEIADGCEIAEVAFLPKDVEDDKIVSPLKKVLRVASKDDLRKVEVANNKISSVKETVEKLVQQLNLDMKIVNVSSVALGNKILIEFISDNRVDFRELLKQLASQLKTRIELKQIGQRDEVKEKGGIGSCGEVCCCRRFLKDFEHVSIKMAKNQGLALNPNKISGLCGKLLCCLAYENDFYVDAIKNMPKINQEVETPEGKGKVVYNDILKGLVTIVLFNKEDNVQKTFALDQIKFTKTKKENKEEGE